jgi:hypothetical protein
MNIYLRNTTKKYVLVFDIEFDHQTLIQFSGLLFERIGEDIYQLSRSANSYATKKLSYPFMQYTGIYQKYLDENSITKEDLIQLIEDDFLKDVPRDELLLVSHGLKSDQTILQMNFVNFIFDSITLQKIEGYCTAENARKILKRNSELTLEDLSNECGYYISQPHDAYHDT